MDNKIFGQVDEYINNLLANEDKALTDTLASLEREGIENISVSANQGKLLQVFAKSCNAKRILELGTLVGYSTIWMARALPADGKLTTVEYSEHNARVAQENIDNAGLSEKVEIRQGKALDVLTEMIVNNEAAFDMVFIDADKPPYTEYFKLALKLSRPGTIIICDNVIRGGAVMDEHNQEDKVTGVQRLNKFLVDCEDVTATIIQTVGAKDHDGMAIAVVKK